MSTSEVCTVQQIIHGRRGTYKLIPVKLQNTKKVWVRKPGRGIIPARACSLERYDYQKHKENTASSLKVVGVAELVDEPLASLGLLHDPFLVVLAQGTGQLVVVHGGTVLPLTPQGRYLDGVNDLEDSLLPVDPVDVVAVGGRLQQELLDKLPQVDVGARLGGDVLGVVGLLVRDV